MFDNNRIFASDMRWFNLTNAQIAKWLDKSQATISHWRTGKAKIPEAYFDLFKKRLEAHLSAFVKAGYESAEKIHRETKAFEGEIIENQIERRKFEEKKRKSERIKKDTRKKIEQLEEDKKLFYPKRGGGHNLKRAGKKYIVLREKFTREQIAESFKRYNDYCEKLNIIGTEKVKMLSTFLAAEENIEIDWSVRIYEQQENATTKVLRRCYKNIARDNF